jgi:quinol monooxygenase YgiN
MFAWMMHFRIFPDRVREFRILYRREILPAIREQEGNINTFLIELTDRRNEFLTIAFWADESASQKYLSGNHFRHISEKLGGILSSPPTGTEYAVHSNQLPT